RGVGRDLPLRPRRGVPRVDGAAPQLGGLLDLGPVAGREAEGGQFLGVAALGVLLPDTDTAGLHAAPPDGEDRHFREPPGVGPWPPSSPAGPIGSTPGRAGSSGTPARRSGWGAPRRTRA